MLLPPTLCRSGRVASVVSRLAEIAIGPRMVQWNFIFGLAYSHQRRQRNDHSIVGQPRTFLGISNHFNLNDSLIVVRLQRRADSSNLDEFRDAELPRIGIKPQ
jgi:hypothetical protein